MTTAAVLTAAGSGTRLGQALPKALVELAGTPLVLRAADALARSGCVAAIVITAPAAHLAAVAALFPAPSHAVLRSGSPPRAARSGVDHSMDSGRDPLRSGAQQGVTHSGAVPGTRVPVVLVAGGSTRQASVAAGLAVLVDDVDVVLVHDAARALASAELVRAVEAAVRAGHRAVVPGVPVTDTIKEVGPGDGVAGAPVRATLDRGVLRAIQTPQGFDRALLEAAHAAGAGRAVDEARAASDDAGLVEALGETVWLVPGEPAALKVTTPLDLALAELLLAR